MLSDYELFWISMRIKLRSFYADEKCCGSKRAQDVSSADADTRKPHGAHSQGQSRQAVLSDTGMRQPAEGAALAKASKEWTVVWYRTLMRRISLGPTPVLLCKRRQHILIRKPVFNFQGVLKAFVKIRQIFKSHLLDKILIFNRIISIGIVFLLPRCREPRIPFA